MWKAFHDFYFVISMFYLMLKIGVLIYLFSQLSQHLKIRYFKTKKKALINDQFCVKLL